MTTGALLDSASQSQDYFWRDFTSRVRSGEENHPQLLIVMTELQQRGILDANWDLIVDLRHNVYENFDNVISRSCQQIFEELEKNLHLVFSKILESWDLSPIQGKNNLRSSFP